MLSHIHSLAIDWFSDRHWTDKSRIKGAGRPIGPPTDIRQLLWAFNRFITRQIRDRQRQLHQVNKSLLKANDPLNEHARASRSAHRSEHWRVKSQLTFTSATAFCCRRGYSTHVESRTQIRSSRNNSFSLSRESKWQTPFGVMMMIWNYFVKLNNLQKKSSVTKKQDIIIIIAEKCWRRKNSEFIIVDLGYFLDGCGSG